MTTLPGQINHRHRRTRQNQATPTLPNHRHAMQSNQHLLPRKHPDQQTHMVLNSVWQDQRPFLKGHGSSAPMLPPYFLSKLTSPFARAWMVWVHGMRGWCVCKHGRMKRSKTYTGKYRNIANITHMVLIVQGALISAGTRKRNNHRGRHFRSTTDLNS